MPPFVYIALYDCFTPTHIYGKKSGCLTMSYIINITPDLPFLNIHNPFTNRRISVYLDKHNRKHKGLATCLRTWL